jgi:hypothetical protein
MTEHLNFDTVCPNNHNLSVTFTQKDFEASLRSDTLVFHCNTCEANWPPTKDEIATIRKAFLKGSE